MKKYFVFICVLFVIFSGCVSNYNTISVKHDEFLGTTRYSTACEIKTSSIGMGVLEIFATNTPTIVTLGLEKIISSEKDTIFYISIFFSSHKWLFIQEGESLILLVDGESIKLFGTGSTDHRDVTSLLSSVRVNEQSMYPVTPELIKKISLASNVRLKIIGKNESITGEFTDQCFTNFKKFIEEAIETP